MGQISYQLSACPHPFGFEFLQCDNFATNKMYIANMNMLIRAKIKRFHSKQKIFETMKAETTMSETNKANTTISDTKYLTQPYPSKTTRTYVKSSY